MQNLIATYHRLLAETNLHFKRYIFNWINWNNRLIIIRGAKGVGKTTMMLQHIKECGAIDKSFYASLDNIWFGNHTIVSLVDYMYKHGVGCVYLDEVHKYPNWRQEIKNIYDSYPTMKLVVTGSSMLELTSSAIGDLSRRVRLYTMKGLSLREYLNFDLGTNFNALPLDEILGNHLKLAMSITSKIKILKHFDAYLRNGYYPFYKEAGDGFSDRLSRVIETIIEAEIPAVGNLNYSSVFKVKQLLSIMASQTPFTLNVSALSKSLEISRESLLKLIDLLSKAALTTNLYAGSGFNSLAKPMKILFENTNIMNVLSDHIDKGTSRETFFASQLRDSHKIAMPQAGDLLIDDKYLFEVGGKGKKFSQIKGIPQSYVVSDDIETGFGNRIPLWLFGFLY